MINDRILEQIKKNPVGRPPKYETAEQLQAKIIEYFQEGCLSKIGVGKDNEEILAPKLTITGLVLYLGFCDRASFYDLEKQDKFSYTIKSARTIVENYYEEHLTHTTVAGIIFALKNLGWKDQQQHELSGDLKFTNLLNGACKKSDDPNITD